MCKADRLAAETWSRVPKVSAEGPHTLQSGELMYRPWQEAFRSVDWETPVFKLTHRLSENGIKAGSLLEYLLDRNADDQQIFEPTPRPLAAGTAPKSFASLKVSTENLGDHIQILAGLRLLARLGVEPARFIDRDNEIQSLPGLDEEEGPIGILLNGWFKANRTEWPPHPKLTPIIYGFHIRLFQCPELLSETSIKFFRSHQPIGCRDVHTETLLRSNGVEAFTSNCLSLTLSRRIDNPVSQVEVFVVSRDERIKDYLPQSIGPYTFINHYSGSSDFAANMKRTEEVLATYRSRARLVITTFLHSALPAIAMGIPVIVFYPINEETAHESDRERFSSLENLLRVYRLEEIDSVNWKPKPVDVSKIKLQILDRFYEMAARWQITPGSTIGPIASSSALPPP